MCTELWTHTRFVNKVSLVLNKFSGKKRWYAEWFVIWNTSFDLNFQDLAQVTHAKEKENKTVIKQAISTFLALLVDGANWFNSISGPQLSPFFFLSQITVWSFLHLFTFTLSYIPNSSATKNSKLLYMIW